MTDSSEGSSLGAILIQMGAIDRDHLLDAIELQRVIREEARLGRLLVENGFCTKEDVDAALSKQRDLRKADHAHNALDIADVVIQRRRTKSIVERQNRLVEKAGEVVKRISDEYLSVTPDMLNKKPDEEPK